MDSSRGQIVEYDPAWESAYAVEAEELKSTLGDSLVSIEHIGSTSIPRLAAKPIIDIAALIGRHEDAEKWIEPLRRIGYTYDQPASSGERHFFRKGSPTRFHLSVCYQSRGGFLRRQILFRDWLRTHQEDRERYQALKRQLIEHDPTGGGAYIEGKSDFIREILQKGGTDV